MPFPLERLTLLSSMRKFHCCFLLRVSHPPCTSFLVQVTGRKRLEMLVIVENSIRYRIMMQLTEVEAAETTLQNGKEADK